MDTLKRKDKKQLNKCRKNVFSFGEPDTIRVIFDRCSKAYSGRDCIAEKVKNVTVTHTYDEFSSDVAAVSEFLCGRGLAGAHIGIVGENSYRWVVAFFACVCIGCVAVPIDKELTDNEIAALMIKADVKAVFCSGAYHKAGLEVLNRSDADICVSLSDKTTDGVIDFTQCKTEGEKLIKEGSDGFLNNVPSADDPAVIIFTSGTTGANKGVILTHANLCANVCVLADIIKSCSAFSVLPMNHAYELGCSVLPAIYLNAVLCINDRLRNIQRNISEFKPEAMVAVPMITDAFYDSIISETEKRGKLKELKKLINLSNALRKIGIDIRRLLFKTLAQPFGGRFPVIACGGASVNSEKMKFLDDIGFKVYVGYGLTEASPLAALNTDISINPDSVGKAVKCTQIRIDSPSADGSGEILIRGKNVTPGYYNDDVANSVSFVDGWFRTGDYGRLSADGELYITGRKKNLIILGNGKNVYPEEIENIIADNSDIIKESVVFQTEDGSSSGGKLAAVVGLAGSDFRGKTPSEIMDIVNAEIYRINRLLPGYKRIHEVKFMLSPFPKTSTMKIIRRDVIEAYNKNIGADKLCMTR